MTFAARFPPHRVSKRQRHNASSRFRGFTFLLLVEIGVTEMGDKFLIRRASAVRRKKVTNGVHRHDVLGRGHCCCGKLVMKTQNVFIGPWSSKMTGLDEKFLQEISNESRKKGREFLRAENWPGEMFFSSLDDEGNEGEEEEITGEEMSRR